MKLGLRPSNPRKRIHKWDFRYSACCKLTTKAHHDVFSVVDYFADNFSLFLVATV
jgi:hypothetical protein